ncbi:hypothetical protein BDN71DRAFT_1443891 [Pleurotus eryngii]|uniref:Uncharacterized protein n=1 Tax=Pleurotus eryngii TaxID=5323 RepID=A0A9P6A216_PLEER|nr:hypothetical protein BDN71DRAFT_1443891 [Pleurotus eryngii]
MQARTPSQCTSWRRPNTIDSTSGWLPRLSFVGVFEPLDARTPSAGATLSQFHNQLNKHPFEGMWMVVMQPLSSDFQPCSVFHPFSDQCKPSIRSTLTRFHALGFVHGDLRHEQYLSQTSWRSLGMSVHRLRLSGAQGMAKYPIGVYSTDSGPAHIWMTTSSLLRTTRVLWRNS